jgi:Lrp/AsnC family transcriptional regulator for asnA, asnC and gidA
LNHAKIDEIDAKILQMLLTEARTSFTDIAKECKITVGAVRMRYKRLLKEGTINGEVTLINPHCLGYRHIIDLGIITDVENEPEIARYLETKPYISAVVLHLGKYNFYGKIALRDLNLLTKILEDIEANPKIKRVDPIIWAEAVNVEHPSNLLIRPLPWNNGHTVRPEITNMDQAPVMLDEIDRQIALILSTKSRTPFRQIAEQLNISTKTVIQRYRKLRENLLVRSTITLDLNKLGYHAIGDLYIKVSNRSKMTEIYNQLLNIPNVIVIIRLIGTYDLYVAVALEDFNKMFEVSAKISKINGLEKPDFFVTPMMSAWPLNLFSSMLEEKGMPKYWLSRPDTQLEDA